MQSSLIHRKCALCLALLAFGLATAQSALADVVVRVRGSSTFLPFVQSVAEDYMKRTPGVSVVVVGGGSSRGYKAVLDDTADIAFTSGPIAEVLQREAERRELKLQSTRVGYRALVAAVHPSQPMNNITLPELRAVFTGRMSKWPSHGGHASDPIDVLVGRPTSGVTLEWRELVLHEDDTFTPKAPVIAEEERAGALLRMPHAITYLPLGSPHAAETKTLLINGVAPTPANVLNRTYPLRAELVLVTREKVSPAAQAFVKAFAKQQPGWRLDGLIVAPPSPAGARS